MADQLLRRRIRRSLKRQRVFRDRRNPLDSMEDNEIYDAFRFRCHELLVICDELVNDVAFDAPRKGSLPSVMQVPLI